MRGTHMKFLATLLSAACFVTWCYADQNEQEKMDLEFSRVCQRMGQADLPGLTAMIDEIASGWKSRSMDSYGKLMLRLVEVTHKTVPQDEAGLAKAREAAQIALQTYDPRSADNISIDTHYWLTVWLLEEFVYQKGKMTDEEWSADRRIKALKWMVPWDRMEAAIDPKWDSEDRPFINVMPPAETQLPPGIAPSEIKDPDLRAEYERAIEENRQKAARHGEQMTLRRLKKPLTRSLVHFFRSTYSVPPYNDTELNSILTEHIKGSAVRDRILREVEQCKGSAGPQPPPIE